jgi:hypothetical protein
MKLPSKSPLVRKKFLKHFAISVLSFLLFGENQALGINNCPSETGAIYTTIIRGNEGNNIISGTGSDTILGLEGDDELNGCHGDDRLEGGPGMDTLIGGKGKDHFVFDSKMEGDNNNDIISDFKAGEDKIVLSRKVFSSLRENDDLTKLNPTELALGKSAISSEVRILFDPNKSILYYDSDGSGINKAIPFAEVKGIREVDLSSFVLEGNPTISIVTKVSKLVYSNLIIILLLILLLERIICHVWSHPFSLSSTHADEKREQNSIDSNSRNLDEYNQKSMGDGKMILDRLNKIIELVHSLSRLDVSIDELKKSIGDLKYSSIQNQQSESKHVAHDDSDSPQAAQSLAVHLVKSTNSNPLTKLIENICYAVDRNDRALLQEMALHELNLVDDFEDEYLRRSNQKTQLQIAQDNGSYYLINCDEQYWVIPSIRTLKNFSMNQPPKGIFNYEPQEIDSPRLRQPAEVREVSGLWEVINMGIIFVPK